MRQFVLFTAILALTWSSFDHGLTGFSHLDLGLGIRAAAADEDDEADGGEEDNGIEEQAIEDEAASEADEEDPNEEPDEGENEDEDEDEDGDEDDADGEDDGDDDDEVSEDASADVTDAGENLRDGSDVELDDGVRFQVLPVDPTENDGLIEPDEILAIAPDPAALDQIAALGFTIVAREALAALDLEVAQIVVPAERDLNDVLEELRATTPDIVFETNHVYGLAGKACEGNRCYGSDLIGWSGDRGSCGAGIRIGLIDSGVDASEAALRGGQVRQRSFLGNRMPAPSDHGTAIAALLVARDNETFTGLLPQAELLVAAAFYQRSDGSVRANALALARGLNWLVAEGAAVINFSLTGPPNALLELSVARAHAAGAIIVAAAGNRGPSGPPLYPGAYDEALAITAVDRYLRIYRNANRGRYLFAAAPGVGIWSPTGGAQGRAWDGTSFAAVFAAAILAEMSTSDATPGRMAQTAAGTARDLGAPGRDNVYGWGLMASQPRCLS